MITHHIPVTTMIHIPTEMSPNLAHTVVITPINTTHIPIKIIVTDIPVKTRQVTTHIPVKICPVYIPVILQGPPEDHRNT